MLPFFKANKQHSNLIKILKFLNKCILKWITESTHIV